MMGFPDNWTNIEGVPKTRRLYMLGNAVVVQQAEHAARWLTQTLETTCE